MAVESTVADSSETTATPEPVDSQVCRSSSSGRDSEQASPDSSSLVEGEPQSRPASAAAATATPASVIRSVKAEQEQQRPPRIEVIVGPRLFQPEFRPDQQVGSKQQRGAASNTWLVSSSTSPGPCYSRTMSPIPPVNVMGPPPPPPPQQQSLPPALIPVSAPPAASRPASKAGANQRIRKSTAQRRHHPSAAMDHEEPSSSIPEIGESLRKDISVARIFSSVVKKTGRSPP